jgi:hypothetical protein
MRQIRHPLSGAVYELNDGGDILVTKDGATGRFTTDGRWLDGEVRAADPELCRWIGSGNYGGVALNASRRYVLTTASAPEGAEAP